MTPLSRRAAASALASLLALAGACRSDSPTAPWARPTAGASARAATAAASDRHLFLLKGAARADFADAVALRGGTVVSALPQIGVMITAGLSDADAQALAGAGDVVARDLEASWIPAGEVMVQAADATLAGGVDAQSLNSPLAAAFLPFQWNMRRIQAPPAWARATGIPSVKVAMLDTGIDPDHLDLMGPIVDKVASRAFVPSVSGPPEWADDNGHGSFTAAIVSSNNFGVAGVAPNVTLMAVKVLGADGRGPLGAVVAGIVYATDAGAQVINMSLGTPVQKNQPGASTVLSVFNRAVNYAKRHGVLVVSAAGNEGVDLQHDRNFVYIPCEAGVQMCVSATASNDAPASYTNFGASAIAVAAPGGDGPPSLATWILGPCSSRSVDPLFASCKDRVSYIIAAGTSASAPHVAGLGALLDSQYGGMLNASQLITLIQQHADDLGKPGVDQYYGQGRINVNATIGSR